MRTSQPPELCLVIVWRENLARPCCISDLQNLALKKSQRRRPSRWQRSKTWQSPSSPQIHQKYIYMWNNPYRTPTECWRTTSDFPKAVWLTGSSCSGQVSGQWLWGGRAEFRTLVHQRPPRSMYYQMAKALPEISISTLRPSSTQRAASYSARHPMPNN